MKFATCVGKGTLMHTITLSNASIDDFRYVRKKGKIYRSALNSTARTNLDYAMLFYFILKFLIQNSWFGDLLILDAYLLSLIVDSGLF